MSGASDIHLLPAHQMIIQCSPRGLCSWDYLLHGDGHQAIAGFDWIGEKGQLDIDRESHAVSKQGIFSGEWSLDSKSGTLFTARKPSAFTRTFEISCPTASATLSAQSALGRTMLLQGNHVDCSITPAHPFTRRASIVGNCEDFKLAAFAFWLTALVWRRAARNNSGNAGS
jgi:hypothetical protein